MSFQSLKKQSSLGSLTEKLVKEVEKMNTGAQGGADDRLWKPTMGKGDVGSAIIRFLPAPDGEDLPWVKMYNHAFQGNGGWLIDNCLTTLGQKCPVCASNSELWNSGNDRDKEIARQRKRKLSYYSNIYVIKDPANQENEGKVFLFKYGKKIFDKILNSMQPEFEDEEPINPFDFWKGANFRLKIRKVEGYWNYDKSEFDSSEPLLEDDDAMEAIWKKEYSLASIVAPDQFKTYEDLEKRLNFVLGTGKVAPKSSTADQEEEYDSYVTQSSTTDNLMEELEQSYRNSKTVNVPTEDEDDSEDTLSYFKKLAES
jgi:hypothetical protein